MKCFTHSFVSLSKKVLSYGLLISLPFTAVAQETVPLSISMENFDYSYFVKVEVRVGQYSIIFDNSGPKGVEFSFEGSRS